MILKVRGWGKRGLVDHIMVDFGMKCPHSIMELNVPQGKPFQVGCDGSNGWFYRGGGLEPSQQFFHLIL